MPGWTGAMKRKYRGARSRRKPILAILMPSRSSRIDVLICSASRFSESRSRKFSLKSGYGFADYLLFLDGLPVGAVEANKEGATLTGVEVQTATYAAGLPDSLKAPTRPLLFLYGSTGIETQCANLLDPDPRSRRVFPFHLPALSALITWARGHCS
jgi:type I site-specific restriction endonuclease